MLFIKQKDIKLTHNLEIIKSIYSESKN